MKKWLAALVIITLPAITAYSFEDSVIQTNTINNAEFITEWRYELSDLGSTPCTATLLWAKGVAGADVTIPNYVSDGVNVWTVTKIGDGALANNPGLIKVSVPNTILDIGAYAFSNCTALAEVTLNYGTRYIGERAFVNTAVREINIPDTIIDMGGNISAGTLFTSTISIGNSSHFKYSADGVLYNRDMTKLYACPTRAEGTVTIPNTVTNIAVDAFFGCHRLSYLNLPATVNTIGNGAFNVAGIWPGLSAPESEPKLKSVFFNGPPPPNAADDIYSGAPDDLVNYALDSAWDGITTWKGKPVIAIDGANPPVLSYTDASNITWFYRITNNEVELYNEDADGNPTVAVSPASTSGVDYKENEDSLVFRRALKIPNSINGFAVTKIGAHAFDGCAALSCLGIPASIREIGDYAFRGCTAITSIGAVDDVPFNVEANKITLPTGVTTLGLRPFEGLKVSSVSLPYTLTDLNGNPVAGCAFVTSLSVDASCPSYYSDGNILYNKRKDTVVAIPANYDGSSVSFLGSVTKIGDEAMIGCKNVSQIQIPDSLTAIGARAFAGCESIQSLSMPDTLATIGDAAFSGCSSLTSVLYAGNAPTASDDIYAGTPEDLETVVEHEAEGWGALPGTWKNRPIRARDSGESHDGIYTDGIWYWVVQDGEAIIYNNGNCALVNPMTIGSVQVPEKVKDKDTMEEFPVAALGPRALYGCKQVAGVSLPDTLQSIGAEAFSGTRITTLHIPEFVESIEGNPGAGCARITGFTVDEGNIDFFADEDGILYDYYGEELIGVPARATAVTIPESVVLVWADAFASCKSLTNATYLCDAPQLESDDIYADTSATKFKTYAEAGTTGWDGTSTTNMPTSGLWPTTGANGRPIVSLYKPDGEGGSTGVILSETDSNGNTWYYRVVDGVAEIWRNGETAVSAEDTPILSVTLPVALGGYVVKGIGDGALSNLRGITGVSIPSTYEWIGDFAFSNCTSLASANLGDGIVEIGKWPFYGTKITELTIPDSVESIDGNPVAGAKLARQVIVSDDQPCFSTVDGVLYDKNATTMLACPATKDMITVPETMTDIADDALYGCHVAFGGKATDGDITWTYEIVDGKAVITDASGTSPTVTIPNTLGGAPVSKIELNALNALTNVNSFVSLSDAYTTRNGVLYSADGTRLIRVPSEMTLPHAIMAETRTTRFSVTTVPGVQIVNGMPVDLTTVTTNTLSDSRTVTTNFVNGDISFDQLLANVVIIDDYAFTGCNIFTNTYVATTNSTDDGYVGYTASNTPYVVVIMELVVKSSTYTTTLPLPGSVLSVGPNALANSGVTVKGDLPGVKISDYPYSVTVESYSADAAIALAEELMPLDSPFPSVVGDDAYRAYFTISATSAGNGRYTVTAELDEAAIGYSQSVSEMAASISDVASGATDETTISVKPGLYYAIAATSALDKPYTIVDYHLATGNTLTLKMIRPSTQSGYYKLLVGVSEITSCE